MRAGTPAARPRPRRRHGTDQPVRDHWDAITGADVSWLINSTLKRFSGNQGRSLSVNPLPGSLG